MLDFLKSIYYEFLSYFVPEKMEYEITGECKNAANAVITCTVLTHTPQKNSK